MVHLSLVVLLFTLSGCASLERKCVTLEVGDSARADIIVGPWASVSIQGPATWVSAPMGMEPGHCFVHTSTQVLGDPS